MRKILPLIPAVVAVLSLLNVTAHAKPETLMDLFAGRDTPACPKYQRTPRDRCNLVVQQPSGNLSLGHAKSYQSNGGPRCKTICRFTGTQD